MLSITNRKFLLFLLSLSLVAAALLVAHRSTAVDDGAMFSAPCRAHWFGTDLVGNDVLGKCFSALVVIVVTVCIVLPLIYVGGIVIGSVLSYFDSLRVREFLLGLVHYWVTLPVLLIAIFLLILTGAGQRNVVAVLIFVLLPSQSLYVYNRMEEVKKRAFVTVKRSYGFSRKYVLLNHVLPYIRNSFDSYTLSRLPEVLRMDLAFNFLGLGVQPPKASFGKMLFEGLSFMFAGWWMWLFPLILVIVVFVVVNWIAKRIICREKEHYGQEEEKIAD
jgi:peptide/nickel transport system permease protein